MGKTETKTYREIKEIWGKQRWYMENFKYSINILKEKIGHILFINQDLDDIKNSKNKNGLEKLKDVLIEIKTSKISWQR